MTRSISVGQSASQYGILDWPCCLLFLSEDCLLGRPSLLSTDMNALYAHYDPESQGIVMIDVGLLGKESNQWLTTIKVSD